MVTVCVLVTHSQDVRRRSTALRESLTNWSCSTQCKSEEEDVSVWNGIPGVWLGFKQGWDFDAGGCPSHRKMHEAPQRTGAVPLDGAAPNIENHCRQKLA